MRFLFVTQVKDVHALAVEFALKSRGHDVVKWYTSDFPLKQCITFNINDQCEYKSKIIGPEICDNGELFDVVWLRRPSRPVLDLKDLHPSDRCVAAEECERFFRCIWDAIAPEARWLNPYHGHLRANNKILQLQMAMRVGLRIPPTLVTNNPVDIGMFISKYGKKPLIYKCFAQYRWGLPDGGIARTQTSVINPDDMPIDAILQRVPGIYQPLIEKKYDVRANFFGDHDISVQIHSQEHRDGIYDWRQIPLDEMKIEQVYIPDDVKYKCISLMKLLGIKFGCFDFVVDENDNYIFLEVNEMGQFLWIEVVDPKIKILSTFVNFIEKIASGYAPDSSMFDNIDDDLSYVELSDDPVFQEELHRQEMTHLVYERLPIPE
ncbi:MAG: hypothetical protein D6732_13535 [Methanobacteriota archaeon]|nr:MAG: hypothetical protein D6732_13535 [Euryarchaeota archaeon]